MKHKILSTISQKYATELPKIGVHCNHNITYVACNKNFLWQAK
jgi:hypothetical protein